MSAAGIVVLVRWGHRPLKVCHVARSRCAGGLLGSMIEVQSFGRRREPSAGGWLYTGDVRNMGPHLPKAPCTVKVYT